MKFGERIRELRREKGFTLRVLAKRVGVGFTYLSKIENHKLNEGHGPSESLIHRLAIELDADEDELMMLAEKVPSRLQKRMLKYPDAFRAFADLDDEQLSRLAKQAIRMK